MAVVNRKCADCTKYMVCLWSKTIDKFDNEVAKNPIGVEIEILSCPEFEEVKNK